MGIFGSISGLVTVRITSADCVSILEMVSKSGIQAFHVTRLDELTIQIQVFRKNYRELKKKVKQKGAKISLIRRHGVYWVGKGLLARPWLIVGLLLLVAVTIYLPTRILFIEVEGNTSIPSKLILDKANSCGIFFGASRKDVRSERVKNSLLGAIPELQWVGVNTSGCTAVISVTERTATQAIESDYGVSSIIASRDGVIVSSTVTKGNALCKPGQAVKAGEVLVSGYTDCGLCIQATRSEAEILAQTRREFTAVTPLKYTKRENLTDTVKNYSVIIGKDKINIGKQTAIDTAHAYKTCRVYRLTLPGGFVLPVTIVVETVQQYETSDMLVSNENAQEFLEEHLRSYLSQEMIGGKITAETTTYFRKDSIGCLYAGYACLEMIGIEKMENKIGPVDSLP